MFSKITNRILTLFILSFILISCSSESKSLLKDCETIRETTILFYENGGEKHNFESTKTIHKNLWKNLKDARLAIASKEISEVTLYPNTWEELNSKLSTGEISPYWDLKFTLNSICSEVGLPDVTSGSR